MKNRRPNNHSGAAAFYAAIGLVIFASPTAARNDIIDFPVEVTKQYKGRESLRDIPFYMKKQKHPAVAELMGEYTTNQRTNAFNKSDEHACSIVFQSAIIRLQKRAHQLGGDAIVDIVSITRHQNLESANQFRCAVGNIIANVALKGRVVKLK